VFSLPASVAFFFSFFSCFFFCSLFCLFFSYFFCSLFALSLCVSPPPLGQQPRLLYSLYTTLFRKQILH
jgi:hypothetical protein